MLRDQTLLQATTDAGVLIVFYAFRINVNLQELYNHRRSHQQQRLAFMGGIFASGTDLDDQTRAGIATMAAKHMCRKRKLEYPNNVHTKLHGPIHFQSQNRERRSGEVVGPSPQKVRHRVVIPMPSIQLPCLLYSMSMGSRSSSG